MADDKVSRNCVSFFQYILQDFQLSKAQLIVPIIKCIYTWKLPFNLTFRAMEHSAFLQGKKTHCLTHTLHFWQSLSETLCLITEIIILRWCSLHAGMSYMPLCLTVTDLIPVSHCYNTLHFVLLLLLLTPLRMTVWSIIRDLAQRECKIRNSNFRLSTLSHAPCKTGIRLFICHFSTRKSFFQAYSKYFSFC